MQRLDAGGAARGDLVELDACAGQPQGSDGISEMALAAAAGRLGAAWILEAGERARLIGTHGDAAVRSLASPAPISDSVPRSRSAAGRVSMTATRAGQLLIAYRTPPGPCERGDGGRCAHYVARLHPQVAPSRGRGVELREVPEPCDVMLAGTLVQAGTWFDAVCAHKPEPVTTVFVIQPEISYAEAIEALPGCLPLGLAPTERGAVLLGRCGAQLGARTLSPDGRDDRELRAAVRAVTCRDGRPRLTLGDQDGPAAELSLTSHMSGLGLLLPPELAPAGARAVFTGESILVARAREGRLLLQRHACVASHLEPVDR
ncbi:MAG: hypothetical protein OXT09_01235 [Myxococcales bacterium]|nr:hypothetical protein [Myxococcales bacterium]